MTNVANNEQIYRVGYRGGSGGFIFLHFLMLSEEWSEHGYHYNDQYPDFDSIIKHQWNITNHSLWKQNEVWPDNYATLATKSDLKKLLYYCNPDKLEFDNRVFCIFGTCYNNIKDSQWPLIKTVDDFNNLPQRIQQEVFDTIPNAQCYVKSSSNLPTSIWLYTDSESQHELSYFKKAYFYHSNPAREKIINFHSCGLSQTWNNELVDVKAIYFLENSDIQIKLQDWVNDPELLIQHGLIDSINQKQLDLLTRWKKLHPAELLEKIGIK
jgi:hypothetical protein